MKYGLIGERLGHSFSKMIHKELSDYNYELCELKPDELCEFMQIKNFCGINVTMPYKEAVIPYLDWIDDAAREIGAVNTVVKRQGKLYGYNTDLYGIKALIAHAEIDVKGKKAAILGTGGTAKTAHYALKSFEAGEILLVSRQKKDGCIDYTELYEKHSDCEIILNTTPLGMYPALEGCAVDPARFPNLTGMIDVIYNPINSTLVQRAKELSVKAEGGLYMLVAQAVAASELFIGRSYPDGTTERIFKKIKSKKENIVLIGMPSSGKSTAARNLAERLNRRAVDTDSLITKRIGMTIKDFFARHGEEKFREIEAQIIKELAGESSLIIATGGGSVLNNENIKNLRYNGRIFFLDRSLESLKPTASRPLSSSVDAMKRIYDERYPIYSTLCDVRIDADCGTKDVTDKIMEHYL